MTSVAVVVSKFPLLSETFIVSQIAGLMACGLDVTVVCDQVVASAGIDLNAEPLRSIVAITRPRWVFDRFSRRIVRALPSVGQRFAGPMLDFISDWQLNRYDVLLAHFGANGRRLARAARWGVIRRPFATVLHGVDVAEPYHQNNMQVYRTLFRTGASFLPVCALFRQIAIDAGADAQRIVVIPMGVDCREIAFVPRSWQGRAEGPRIITVARLVEKKGVEFALRALALVAARKPDTAWHYDIIGDGPLRPALEALAATLGLTGRVTFHGPCPHAAVKAWLQQAHIFLLPSVTSASGDMEGLPVALTEAMAAGLTVISSRHSGIPDLVKDGVNGLLADERDAQALSTHLEWAIANPAACMALAHAARETVERHFENAALHARLARLLVDLATPRATLRTP